MVDYLIFVVDDEETITDGICLSLGGRYRVAPFARAEAALEAMKAEAPDLVLLDIGLPGMSGIEALREMKRRVPEVLVIMITAYEDVDTVISAMKLGADDYVEVLTYWGTGIAPQSVITSTPEPATLALLLLGGLALLRRRA